MGVMDPATLNPNGTHNPQKTVDLGYTVILTLGAESVNRDSEITVPRVLLNLQTVDTC